MSVFLSLREEVVLFNFEWNCNLSVGVFFCDEFNLDVC